MTEPIGYSTAREKNYSSIDDEPLVCTSDAPNATGCSQTARKADEPMSVCCLEELASHPFPTPSFGAFGQSEAPSGDNPNDGAHGSGQAPIAARTPPAPTKAGPRSGIAIGWELSAAYGDIAGVSYSVGQGLLFHEKGVSQYETGMPAGPLGLPMVLSPAVLGASAGIGFSLQYVHDIDAFDGQGVEFSGDYNGATLSVGFSSDHRLNSLGVTLGPSVGVAAHARQTETHVK